MLRRAHWGGWVALLIILQAGAAPGKSDFTWSGHLRANASAGHYDAEQVLARSQDQNLFYDGGADFRLNASYYANDRLSFHAAYEAVFTGGQTRGAIADLSENLPAAAQDLVLQADTPSDQGQFFSLSKVIAEEDDYILYHRIDRLYASYEDHFGSIAIGRQALTWGNGLLFNPADLVNPFAPSDIIRDYKIGSDMILYQHGFEKLQDIQAVAVLRRDADDDPSFEESTFGMKFRLSAEQRDFDLYVMKNYADPVIGGGFVSYLGDGVLRSDLTWTYLEDDPDRESFFAAVVDYDYSWSWADKNWYGFLEFYANGLGSSDVHDTRTNEALLIRLQRGEIFVTGRYYLNGMLQYEAHPLVNIYATLIYNLEDDSFLLQPRVSWDFIADAQILAGANIPVGGTDTEFGTQEYPETGAVTGAPLQLYVLLTYYF